MKVLNLSPDQTRRHLLNTSKTKFACAFSKQKRFSPPNPQCKQAFYLKNKSQLSKTGFKIPLSHRSDFTKSQVCSPPSSKYNHKSFFQKNSNKGLTFGISRELSPDRSYLIPQIQKVPGPGHYDDKKQGRTASSYSLRAKTSDFNADRLSYKKTPGPGKYETINLNPKDGKLSLSKFQNAKLTKIHSNTKRFLQSKYAPGPADYVRKDEFSNTGTYFLSKDKSDGRRPFDRSRKIDFTQKFRKLSLTIPSPFTYNKFSDFPQQNQKFLPSFHSTIS